MALQWLTSASKISRKKTRLGRHYAGVKCHMELVTKILDAWEPTHRKSVDLGELFSRDPIAHKWKCTYRVTVLRELVFWRTNDTLRQMVILTSNGHILGARILLRSALETIAMLVYLNIKMQALMERKITLDEFREITSQLMLGSKNESTQFSSINIVTIITKHCERRYEGIAEIYADLSESAHPNYDGVCSGYSYIDETAYVTHFENRWMEKYGDSIEEQALPILRIFENEYNDVFVDTFENLERYMAKRRIAMV